MDVIWAAAFIHLFGLEKQIVVCMRIVEILRAEKGSVVFGRQVGGVKGREVREEANVGGVMMRHDPETFKEMWEEVGRRTGTKWRVEASLRAFDPIVRNATPEEGKDVARYLEFACFRE